MQQRGALTGWQWAAQGLWVALIVALAEVTFSGGALWLQVVVFAGVLLAGVPLAIFVVVPLLRRGLDE